MATPCPQDSFQPRGPGAVAGIEGRARWPGADPSTPVQLTQGHQVALSSISYVGCSLSVLCLLATLATFAVLS